MNHYRVKESVILYLNIEEAIVVTKMADWIKYHASNDQYKFKGSYWIYNTLESWKISFPFWSADKIGRILRSLKDKCMITAERGLSDKFSPQLMWYTISDTGLLELLELDIAVGENIDQFEILWSKYGKKTDKVRAMKSWKRLTGKEREEVLGAVDSFVEHNPELRYRPMLSTFLNGKRWKDEIVPDKPQSRESVNWDDPEQVAEYLKSRKK